MSEVAIEAFMNLYEHDWSTVRYDDWVLVSDTATRYFVDCNDITEDFIAKFRKIQSEHDNVVAYAYLCMNVPGYHVADIPVEVVRKFALPSDMTWGF